MAVAMSSVSLGGCATVLNGTNMDMQFQTNPDGATVEFPSGLTCKTPCEVEMKRGKDAIVTISKVGYKTEKVYIQSRLSGSTFGNIIAGGVIGGVVDGTNGASNHLYPRPAYITLVPNGEEGEAMLLDKKGEVISTLAEHNISVKADVEKGLREQGLTATQMGGQSDTSASSTSEETPAEEAPAEEAPEESPEEGN